VSRVQRAARTIKYHVENESLQEIDCTSTGLHVTSKATTTKIKLITKHIKLI